MVSLVTMSYTFTVPFKKDLECTLYCGRRNVCYDVIMVLDRHVSLY